ncbi:MAG: NAD(P)-dependent oxidoreductase, partial [Planctomycetota bacterium]|nr:NAD(P)-dependent oxidoreductase [Planctomycetota bacterium]
FLGYGHINQWVHRFLGGFDLEFAVLNRSKVLERKDLRQFSSSEKLAFFAHCDVVVLALPHTDETTDFVSHEELRALGAESLLVNVARGAVVNEEALYAALRDGVIAGAALDVWYEYKPEELDGAKRPYSQPFHDLDQVVLSPHRAASPFDDLSRWDEQIENLKRFCNGNPELLNIVDFEAQY